jgi:hypothetical protein
VVYLCKRQIQLIYDSWNVYVKAQNYVLVIECTRYEQNQTCVRISLATTLMQEHDDPGLVTDLYRRGVRSRVQCVVKRMCSQGRRPGLLLLGLPFPVVPGDRNCD